MTCKRKRLKAFYTNVENRGETDQAQQKNTWDAVVSCGHWGCL